jgi:hypothetical protein
VVFIPVFFPPMSFILVLLPLLFSKVNKKEMRGREPLKSIERRRRNTSTRKGTRSKRTARKKNKMKDNG